MSKIHILCSLLDAKYHRVVSCLVAIRKETGVLIDYKAWVRWYAGQNFNEAAHAELWLASWRRCSNPESSLRDKNRRATTQEALINNQQVNGMRKIIILRCLCISMQFNTALASGEGGYHLRRCLSLCMYANIGRMPLNCHIKFLIKTMPKARILGVSFLERWGIASEQSIQDSSSSLSLVFYLKMCTASVFLPLLTKIPEEDT